MSHKIRVSVQPLRTVLVVSANTFSACDRSSVYRTRSVRSRTTDFCVSHTYRFQTVQDVYKRQVLISVTEGIRVSFVNATEKLRKRFLDKTSTETLDSFCLNRYRDQRTTS